MPACVILRMDRLLGAEIVKGEFEGEVVDYIMFPMKANGLLVSASKKIRWLLTIFKKTPTAWGETHYCSVYSPQRDFYKKLQERGYARNLQFIGTIRQNKWNKAQTNAVQRDYDEAMKIEK
jgi:hypothetical protein